MHIIMYLMVIGSYDLITTMDTMDRNEATNWPQLTVADCNDGDDDVKVEEKRLKSLFAVCSN